MAITGRAITEFRDVQVTFTAESQPIDGYKACLRRVEKLEAQYNKDNTSVANQTAQSHYFTGTQNDSLYLYELTLDISAGTYAFDFQSVRNADGSAIV